MAAEQAYHAGIQRTLSRYVTDYGVVCGLDVDSTVVTDDDTDQEVLEVTVSEGLALDRCGRLVAVEDTQRRTEPLPPIADGTETDTVSVYVEYDECFTDPVPAAKMENACEEDCKDNRVVEGAEVTVEPGDPGDYHKSVADVSFPSAEDLGLADDPVAQTLGIQGDIQARDADTGEGGTLTMDLTVSNTAPSDTVEVDISPPQTGDETTIVGSMEVPIDALIGPDGFVLPEGEFALTGGIGEGNSRMAVGGTITATPRDSAVTLEGTISFESPNDRFEIPMEFEIEVDGTELVLDGSISLEEVMWDAEAELSFEARDEQYLLRGSSDIFERRQNERERIGSLETTEWETDTGEEIDGILIDKPAEGGDTDGEAVNLDAALSGPARSYYRNEPRTECPDATAGRILVGTISREGGDWNTTSFTYGPLVYTNDLLYDALVNHTADFDNPHDSVASINGVGPDETGDVDITSDDTIRISRGTHSLNLSVADSQGFPEEYRQYLFEKSLLCECNTFGDLAERFDMETPETIANTLSKHLAAWRSGEADYLDVFEGDMVLHKKEQRLNRELQQDRWQFLGGRDQYGSAVNRLVGIVNEGPSPLAVAIAQLRVCEAAACLEGDCLTFERFPLPRESLPRPFTYDEYIIDSRSNLQLLKTEIGTRLGLPEGAVVIDLPTTDFLEVELFSASAWDNVFLRLVAVDKSGEEHTLFEDEGNTNWGSSHTFSIERENLTRLELEQDGATADLTRLCRR